MGLDVFSCSILLCNFQVSVRITTLSLQYRETTRNDHFLTQADIGNVRHYTESRALLYRSTNVRVRFFSHYFNNLHIALS
jgi:hypothetical protein